MKRILVLCTGNSCRSQMLHGYLAQDPALQVASAGVDPHGLNPRAVAAMAEAGIDISQHASNHVADYAEQPFDLVVIEFIRTEVQSEEISIGLCELSYVNTIRQCEFWSSPRDTPKVVPSFSVIAPGDDSWESGGFDCNFAFRSAANVV